MGLTDEGIDRRKEMVGLTAEDIRTVLSMRDLLLSHVGDNLDAFFDHIRRYEGDKRLFHDPELLARARQMKGEHLRAMVDGEYGRDYVQQRLELALVYSTGELDLKVFVGAFHDLMRNFGEQVMSAHLDDPI
ncbi:MAG: protoglobin domain-containing protein, partial [Candidatus Thermoplasmatota archaeon]